MVRSPVLSLALGVRGHPRHKLADRNGANGHPLHESNVHGGASVHPLDKLVVCGELTV